MGGRFIQVDLDFVDSRACGLLALKLGVDRDSAAGKMLRVWGWALAQAIRAPDGDPIRSGFMAGDEAEILISDAARWSKSASEFIDAGEHADLFARTKKGIRFKGWDERYAPMLRKLRRDAAKPARNPRGTRAESGSVDVDVDPDVDVDVDYRTEDLSSGAEPPKSRKASWQQDFAAEFQRDRLERLARLEVEATPETYPVTFLNKALKTIADAAGGGDAGREAVLAAMDAYFEADWPAKYNPPYPFSAFVSKKVWPKLLGQQQESAA